MGTDVQMFTGLCERDSKLNANCNYNIPSHEKTKTGDNPESWIKTSKNFIQQKKKVVTMSCTPNYSFVSFYDMHI